jgi:hypothetical protein
VRWARQTRHDFRSGPLAPNGEPSASYVAHRQSSWINVTLFDRGLDSVTVRDVRELTLDDEIVGDTATFLGLA